MKRLFITLILTLTMAMAFSQDAENMKKHMDRLSFMVGEWEGDGWYRSPQGSVSNFTQSEQITSKLDGLVLIVEGVGLDDSGQKVHDALAMISFDEDKDEYIFNSHLEDGKAVHASGNFEGELFQWGFELDQGGEVRYSITYVNNVWNETGAYSPDGNNWYPFIEMNLKRKK